MKLLIIKPVKDLNKKNDFKSYQQFVFLDNRN